jgi:HSP20 family molecular chaperone IbpA
MTTLMRRLNHDLEPFDLLFRNFFDTDSFFMPAIESKPKYPVDIYESEDGLQLDIAVVGLDENDINIEITDGDTLIVSYQKEVDTSEKDDQKYIHHGISKKSFSFGWRISNKFDLSKIEATVEKGLLNIYIPCAEEAKPRSIRIKPKKAITSGSKK